MSHHETEESTDIALNGDVVLMVGRCGKKLRVHSAFITSASPVFKAMLGSNFKDGIQLRESGSVDVSLPDDHVSAMETILNVIHGRNDQVPEELAPEDLLQVAIVIDKYDCFIPLVFAIRAWFSHATSNDSTESWAIAAAALILREENMFSKATSSMIFNYHGSFVGLTKKHATPLESTVLLEIAALLEEKRNAVRLALVQIMLHGDWHCSQPKKKGNHRPDHLVEFTKRVGNLDQVPISTMLNALAEIHADAPYSDVWDDATSRTAIIEQIAYYRRQQQEKIGGLCLLCVTTEEEHESHV